MPATQKAPGISKSAKAKKSTGDTKDSNVQTELKFLSSSLKRAKGSKIEKVVAPPVEAPKEVRIETERKSSKKATKTPPTSAEVVAQDMAGKKQKEKNKEKKAVIGDGAGSKKKVADEEPVKSKKSKKGDDDLVPKSPSSSKAVTKLTQKSSPGPWAKSSASKAESSANVLASPGCYDDSEPDDSNEAVMKPAQNSSPGSKTKSSASKTKPSLPTADVAPALHTHARGWYDESDDSDEDSSAYSSEPDQNMLGELPTIHKDDATIKRRLEKAKRQPTEDRGVIYLGRLPHGFYEEQLKGYFSQFGNVTRLRLSRNRKSGRSKHYAFLEFDSSSVAEIVADTMNNYLLMGHLLRCEIIPKDKIHPELWVGANKKWKKTPTHRIERLKHDKPRTEEEIEKAENRLIKRQNEKKRKLEEAGIKYDFDSIAYKKKPKVDPT